MKHLFILFFVLSFLAVSCSQGSYEAEYSKMESVPAMEQDVASRDASAFSSANETSIDPVPVRERKPYRE